MFDISNFNSQNDQLEAQFYDSVFHYFLNQGWNIELAAKQAKEAVNYRREHLK